MNNGRLRFIFKVLIAVIVCQGAGIIGSVFTAPAITGWYAALEKPPFNPPNWLFAPAWISLYLLMGVAAAIVWQYGLSERRVKVSLVIFLVQLALNILWSLVFFGFESPLAGLVVIAALWIAILVTIIRFFEISKTAGVLLLPYIGWVTFASVLNFYIYLLNP